MTDQLLASARDFRERLDFLGLDAAALARLGALAPAARKHLPPALERFYGVLAKVPAVSRFFSGREQMGRAKSAQLDHWSAIASGKLDDHYLQSSAAIGNRHARIGLEPRWYIGGYALVVETLIEGIVRDAVAEATPRRTACSAASSLPSIPSSAIRWASRCQSWSRPCCSMSTSRFRPISTA